MTQENRYNGWTNYETWKVNLELFNESTPECFGIEIHPGDPVTNDLIYECASAMKEYAEECVSPISDLNPKLYPAAFVLGCVNVVYNKVNWSEIAKGFLESFGGKAPDELSGVVW